MTQFDGHKETATVDACTTTGLGTRFVATNDGAAFYGRTSPDRIACAHYIDAETLEDLRETLRRRRAEAADGAPYRGGAE